MCGVVGVIGAQQQDSPNWASSEVYHALLTLQHRGQDAAGILSYNLEKNKFFGHKNLGLVNRVFNKKNLLKLSGNMAIGHTRYATAGSDDHEDVQPLVTGVPFGIGMVHNGNVLNYHKLSLDLQNTSKLQLLTSNDLEVLLQIWCQYFLKTAKSNDVNFTFDRVVLATEEVFKKVKGAFSVVGMVAGKGLIGFRDPSGIRPLVLGKKQVPGQSPSYCLVSETVSLNFLGYDFVRDLEPGECLYIDLSGNLHSKIYKTNQKKAPCMFEWVYFSGAESSFESKSIYGVRLNLGKTLAKKVKTLISSGSLTPDIVSPVPDTARTSAISLAEDLKLPYREALIKNRYSYRSFILNDQTKRDKAVELKLSPIKSEIAGKSILLVDDSIVRGTTSKKIVQLLKKWGAKEVNLVITCPPIRYACFYGVDFPNAEALVAKDRLEEEITKWIGVNRLIYLNEEELKTSIGLPNLCMACVNNDYPTSIEEGKEFAKKRNNYKDIKL